LATLLLAALALASACAAGVSPTVAPPPASLPAPTSTPTASQTPTSTPAPLVFATGTLAPVIAPTRPAVVPSYGELDKTTELHITGTAADIDLATYHLLVIGKVDHRLSLSYDDLRRLPQVSASPELVCPGLFRDYATWAGPRLADVLDLAGVRPDAQSLRLVAADYTTSVSLDAARKGVNLLALTWEGEPLPILHGFPLRAVFSELAGGYWVKWLVRIEVE